MPGAAGNHWTAVLLSASMLLLEPHAPLRADVILASPHGNTVATVSIKPPGRLQYRLERDGEVVLDDSALGVTVDGVDLGTGVVDVHLVELREISESYPWRGAKAVAVNHGTEADLLISRSGSGDGAYQMRWRAHDDGVAFRYRIPGSGSRTITGEASEWLLPAGSIVWTQGNITYYEGLYHSFTLGVPQMITGTPMVCELPGDGGYAGGYVSIMEAELRDYSGMTIRTTSGSRSLTAEFQSEYSWQVDGGSFTPWRVTLTADSLHEMVNSTLLPNLNSPAAPELETAGWIRPGRCLWSWWAHRDANWDARAEDQVFYMDAAEQLGFEFVLWDEGWGNWPTSQLDSLLEYARDKGLGVWLWMRWTALDTPAKRSEFFAWIGAKNQSLNAKVIVGVKIDFMNSERQSTIAWYTATLEDAAGHELMLNFHGAGKPTGMARTYPHEMTREAVRGLEYHIWQDYLTPLHNTALPFTRLLAGHADYTPVTFASDYLGSTSCAHQLAMAFLLTSPVTHWADDPVRYLNSPARDVISAAPTVWDETHVLDASRIGELAAMARRHEDVWFLAMANGSDTSDRRLEVGLSFLQPWDYDAVLLTDSASTPAALERIERAVTNTDRIGVEMRPGGGFVGMFSPRGVPGDFDRDGDADLSDFGHLQACLSGPFVPQSGPGCRDAMLDADVDVDASDVAIFTACISGEGVRADPACGRH